MQEDVRVEKRNGSAVPVSPFIKSLPRKNR
jgi:hypothetical protein